MRGVLRSDEAGPGDGDLDLSGVGQAIVRAKKWIIGTTLLAFLGALLFVLMVKPRYTAEAKALIENQESYFTRPDRASSEPNQSAPDAEAVASQAQLVNSRDLAREAIRALGLKGNPEFDPAAGAGGFFRKLLGLIGAQSPERAMAPEDRIFDTYFERLFVFPVVKSRVLQIEFSSQDPELAAKAANTIAELYVGVQSKAKRENARLVAASLGALIGDLRAKVTEAERKAEEYRASNGLMIGANNVTMNGQQLGEISNQLTLARAAQAESQAKSRLIRDMLKAGRIAEVPDVANNDMIRRLSDQRSTLRAQIASEGRTLLPGHPRVKELSAQLAEIDSNLRITADKLARTLENDARIAGSRVENLQAVLEQQKKTIGGSSNEEARARDLDRDARLLKEQLESSTTKYQEALARQGAESTPSDARIISRAVEPPLPSFPKTLPILIFATLTGLILSIGSVLASELLSGRAYARQSRPDEAERIEPAIGRRFEIEIAEPALQSAGSAQTQEPPGNDAVQPRDQDERRQAPRSRATLSSFVSAPPENSPPATLGEIARRIIGPGRGGAGVRVLVTGSDSEVETAAMAVALGRLFSAEDRAVLVEAGGEGAADAQGPLGLSELAAGHAGFDEVIHRDRGSPLHLLPAGRIGAAPADGLDGIIEALAQTYDYVILLAPPLGAGAEAFALAGQSDYAVLVRPPDADARDMDEAHAELRRAGAIEILSIIDEEPSEEQRWSAA